MTYLEIWTGPRSCRWWGMGLEKEKVKAVQTLTEINCFHISNFICRSVCLAVSTHGSLNSLHIFEHSKLSATRSLSMPLPPTLPPMPWIYRNVQCKRHLIQEAFPNSLTYSGLGAHLLSFHTLSASLLEHISPAIGLSAYLSFTPRKE